VSAGILAMKINNKIGDEHRAGTTISQLAKKYGVSHQIIRIRVKRDEVCNLRGYWQGLSVRVCNCLDKAGFKSDKEVIERFSENPAFFLKLRNFGRDSFIELKSWVGRSDNPETRIAVRSKIKEIKSLIGEVERLLIELTKEAK
jgi:hypothetical protein